MKHLLFLLVFVVTVILAGDLLYAQCPLVDFSLPASACKNEELILTNTSTNAASYFWDYCDTDLKAALSVTHVATLSDVYRSTFCFDFLRSPGPSVLSLRNNGELNVVPLSMDLKSAGQPVRIEGLTGAFGLPRAIKTIKEDGNYYAVVTNASAGQSLTLVNFGESVQSTATFSRLDGIGVVATNGLEIVANDNGYDVLVGQNSGNTIYHLQFAASILAAPSVRSFTVAGASSINHIKILKTCEGIIAIVSSLNNDKLFLLNFSNDLSSTPVVSELAYTGDPIGDPAKFDVAFDNGEYYMLLHTNLGTVHRLSFGSSLLNTPVSEVLWSQSANGYDIKLVQEDNRWKGLFVDYSVANRRLSLFEFNNSGCGLANSWSNQDSPVLKIPTAGDYPITLTVVDDDGYARAVTKVISITDHTPANIDVSIEGICVESLTAFSSRTDKAITSYEWEFGDGNSSVIEHPFHQYSAPGDYTASLLAIDTDGCKTRRSQSVPIYDAPIADFSLPTGLLCTNNAFTFYSATSDVFEGNLSYTWYVNDVEVASDRDLEFTFASVGRKDIKLVTAIPGCIDEITKETEPLLAGPLIDFSHDGICANDAFTFEAQTTDVVISYDWNFSNGQTSTDPNPSTSFVNAGVYSVSLTARNELGCETVRTKSLLVHTNPTVDFSTDEPPNACTGQKTTFINGTVNLDERPISEWLWEFGDPNSSEPDHQYNGQHVYLQPNTYSVSLTAVTEAGCMSTLQKEISIRPSPATNFIHSPACEDAPVLFTGPPDPLIESSYWEIGTSYSYDASPTHTFAAPGDYPLYAEFYGSNGCISTIEKTIHVPIPLTPDFSVIKNCVGHEAIFTDITNGIDAVATRAWNFGNGRTATTSSVSQIFSQQQTVPVTLQVTTQSGCSYTRTKQVQILPAPVAEFFTSPETGAYPLEATFTNTSSAADHFEWKFFDGTGSTSVDKSPVYTFSTLGTFDITLTAFNAQQCEHSFTSSVTTLAPLPDADIEMVQLVEQPDGSMKLIVTIENKGNTILKNIPMTFDFAGDLSLSQIVAEPIMPGAQFNFVLNSAILNAESLQYLCVALDVQNDLSPKGNRSCSAFDTDFFVFAAYPNPATHELKLEWLSQQSETITVSLTDRVGRTLLRNQVTTVPGLNSHTIDVRALPAGLFVLSIDDGSSKKVQRIAVER